MVVVWKYATRLLIASVIGLGACADDDSKPAGVDAGSGPLALDVPEGCNPLGGGACLLPWPSSIYEFVDDVAPIRTRLVIPQAAMPANLKDERARPELWTRSSDGWSANMPLVVAFATGFDDANLAGEREIERSILDESPTMIVDLETGERVPHIAEKDSQAELYIGALPKEVALILRPAVRLTPGHHYGVAIKKSLKAPDGSDLARTPGFQALIDGTPTDNQRLENARLQHTVLFDLLADAGVPESELVIAWMFTVRSDEPVQRDLLEGRDAVLDAIGETGEGFDFTIESDEISTAEQRNLRIITGSFPAPSLLTGDGGSESVLNRDGEGHVAINGSVAAPLIIVIPKCAADPLLLPLPVVVFGHGLIGSSDEAKGGYMRRFADETCQVVVATDWRGMSFADLDAIGRAFGNIDNIDGVMEKLVQGVTQFVALETLVRKRWAADERLAIDGKPILSDTELRFYGISQGAIFGTTFLAIDPYITKGALGVGASNFSYIIERSTNWKRYRLLAYASYPNPLDVQVLLGLLQMKWDLTDSITYAAHLTGEVLPSLPGVPAKRVLMQISVGDSQVANIGADLWARTAGVKVLEPVAYQNYGMSSSIGPLTSALTQWDEHKEPRPPGGNYTDEDNGTHGSLRGRAQVIEQIRQFFATGMVVQTCQLAGEPAVCDCSTTEVCGP